VTCVCVHVGPAVWASWHAPWQRVGEENQGEVHLL